MKPTVKKVDDKKKEVAKPETKAPATSTQSNLKSTSNAGAANVANKKITLKETADKILKHDGTNKSLKKEDSKGKLEHKKGQSSISNKTITNLDTPTNKVTDPQPADEEFWGEDANITTETSTPKAENLTEPGTSSNHSKSKSVSNLDAELEKEKQKQKEKEDQLIKEKLKLKEKEDVHRTELVDKEKEISNLKKVLQEKNELQQQILELNKKLDKETKAHKDTANLLNNSIKEYESSSNNYQKALSVQKDLNTRISELSQRISGLTKDKAEINKDLEDKIAKLEEFELDLEIKKEEYEGLKLEFEEFKINSMNSQAQNLDENSAQMKIIELESQISALSNALVKIDLDRNKEVQILKKENERLQVKAKEADEVPKRDEIIQILKETIMHNEQTIQELREQLDVFSSASAMMDDLIMEKTKLEDDLSKEREEKGNIRYEMETTEMLMLELETSVKISEKLLLEKDNEIINLNHMIEGNRELGKSLEKKCDDYLNAISELKKENKTIRHEISKMQNVNVEEILNKNNSVTSQLKSYSRQKALPSISHIDVWISDFKNQIILKSLPPTIISSKEGLRYYDKIVSFLGLRRKTLHLIYMLLENEVLFELNKEEDDKGEVEVINDKYINFIESLTVQLSSFFSLLLKLEVILVSKDMNESKYKSLVNRPFWRAIEGSSQYITGMINQIKEDTFGIDYNSQLEDFKTLFKSLQDEANDYVKIYNDKLPEFYSELLRKMVGISLIFNKRFMSSQGKGIDFQKRLGVFNMLKSFIANFRKLSSKIELKFDYNSTNLVNETGNLDFNALESVFEYSGNSAFTAFQEINLYSVSKIDEVEKAIDSCFKICVISISYLEKLELTLNENKEKESFSIIPVQAWSEASSAICQELENTESLKSELEKNIENVMTLKRSLVTLDSQYKDLIKTKEVNEKKLAEATNQLGKIPIIEMEREELQKKIEKYNFTVDSLMGQLMSEQEKVKNLTIQLQKEKNEKKSQLDVPPKTRTGIRTAIDNISSRTGDTKDIKNPEIRLDTGGSAQLLHSMIQMQRERKLLKIKLMKGKLEVLSNENSFINRFINQNESNPDSDIYETIESSLTSINKDYEYTRQKLASTKVHDISKQNYNFEKEKSADLNNLKKLRIDYFSKIDKVLFNLFGSHSVDKSFKDILDNEVIKSLDYFGEKRCLVGRMQFNTCKEDKSAGKKVVIPVFMNENTLKQLNSTFIY